MADEFGPGTEGMVHAFACHRDEAGIAYHMGVGDDPLAPTGNLENESRADPSGNTAGIPWRAVVWGLVGHLDPHDACSEGWER